MDWVSCKNDVNKELNTETNQCEKVVRSKEYCKLIDLYFDSELESCLNWADCTEIGVSEDMALTSLDKATNECVVKEGAERIC